MAKPVRDIGASVRARLLALSREKGRPLDLLLTRYALERLLYRLSVSPYRDRFALKGAILITTWFDDPHRATRDVDLLGYGDRLAQAIVATFDRRGTPLPYALPDALSAEFAKDETKRRQWNAFSADLAIATGPFESVIEDLAIFLMPKVAQARNFAKPDK